MGYMGKELLPLVIGHLKSLYPIVQGGMSTGLTLSELAGAVDNEGCFGTVGGMGLVDIYPGMSKEEFFEACELGLEREILNALTIGKNGNILVNLMVAAINYEKSVEIAVKSGVGGIASGAGIPLYLPQYVEKYKEKYKEEYKNKHGADKEQKIALVPIISSLRVAKIILKQWKRYGVLPDAFIVETPNTAGGHLGVTDVEDIGKDEFSLEVVIPQLIEYFKSDEYAEFLKDFKGEIHDIPIIAAGGIWNRSDIDKMLLLGASGVQMATRFLTTNECHAAPEFKARHLSNDPDKNPIVIIKSPVGMPGRAIENEFIREVNAGKRVNLDACFGCLRGCGKEYCILRALHRVRHGDVENGVLFTGINGNKLKEDRDAGINSVRQIIKRLTVYKTHNKFVA